MTITSRTEGDVLVIAPTGLLTIGTREEEMGAVVRSALDSGAAKILIDLAQVSVLDSAGVGAVLWAHTSASRRQMAIRFCGLSTRLREVLELSGLDQILDLRDDLQAGLADFA